MSLKMPAAETEHCDDVTSDDVSAKVVDIFADHCC